MYKKYLFCWKLYENDTYDARSICFEWENLAEINKKKKEFLEKARKSPLVNVDFKWKPLRGNWQIPFKVWFE